MPSELYQSMGQTQNPKDQAMNLLRQRGIQIPDGISGNPQAIIQHLMNTGQIPQNRLTMAQQMLQRMLHR